MNRLTSAKILQEQENKDISLVHSLHLSHRALSDVSCLKEFSNLERVDLSSNNLSSLEGLSSCSSLKWLSIVQNKLHSLKGIEGLTNLLVLNAGKNRLKSMNEVESLVNVRALILNDNEITSICQLEKLRYVNTIVLSRNPIRDIGQSLTKAKQLTKLSLSHCRLETIGSSLKFCVELRELRLAHNEITGLPSEMARNVKLQNLDLGNNLIQNRSNIKVLSHLQYLKNLNLLGNPVNEKENLLRKIVKLVPNLQVFNAKPIRQSKNHENNSDKVVSIGENKRKIERKTQLEEKDLDEEDNKEMQEKMKRLKHNTSTDSSDGVLEKNVKRGKREKVEVENKAKGKLLPEELDGESEKKGKEKKRNKHNKFQKSSDNIIEKDANKMNPEKFEESGRLGIDDGEIPFLEIVTSNISSNRVGIDKNTRETAGDINNGLIIVSTKKKKTAKCRGSGCSALKSLSPAPEIGLGGPSTWDS